MMLLLMLLTAAGTGTVVYFFMDGPRRRNSFREKELADEKERLRGLRDDLLEEKAQQDAAGHRLRTEEALHRRRGAELEQRSQAFEKRFVSYDDLGTENRLLKADLRNVAMTVARLEFEVGDSVRFCDNVSAARDSIGRSYWEDTLSAARRSVRADNYPATKARLTALFDRLRKAGVTVSRDDESAALRALHDAYEKAVRAAVERERQAELRQQMREELLKQKEIEEAEEEVAEAAREQEAAATALAEALAKAADAHSAEIDALRQQLADAEAKSARAVAQAQLTKTGNVYVISNVGSFGPGVFKIGMTRRLDPMERVIELGDASVPFPFDVHMMISTTDAPKLENALHRKFRHLQVNRVNPRKEFFRVPIDEIVAAVRENHGEVEYTADAEALQFIQSQTMTDEDMKEVEEVFAEAEAAAGGPVADEL